MFTKNSRGKFIVILIYVDDIIIICNNMMTINKLTVVTDGHFKRKDLRNLKFFLSIKVIRSNAEIHIYQRKYTLNLLKEIRKLGIKISKLPLD